MGAVGRDHYIEFLNGTIAMFAKTKGNETNECERLAARKRSLTFSFVTRYPACSCPESTAQVQAVTSFFGLILE